MKRDRWCGWQDYGKLAALGTRLPGYAVTPDTLQRRFLQTPGEIITVRLDRRAHTPSCARPPSPPPPCTLVGNRTLRYEFA